MLEGFWLGTLLGLVLGAYDGFAEGSGVCKGVSNGYLGLNLHSLIFAFCQVLCVKGSGDSDGFFGINLR